MKYLLIVLCANILHGAHSVPFPDQCSITDTSCLKKAAVKAIPILAAGIPQYGIDKVDPFYADEIDASRSTLKLILRDITMRGLNNTQPIKLKFDTEKDKITIGILCDVTMDGYYDMKGSLLILPIEGNGKLHVELNKFYIEFHLDVLKNVKKNKTYLKLKEWKYTYELQAKSKLEFENLFNGNELLGKAVSDLISNNGNEVIMEIGPTVIQAVAAKIINSFKNLIKHLALEDLFLGYSN